MATGKAWGLASSLWEALLAWGAGGGPVEATAPTASTATSGAQGNKLFLSYARGDESTPFARKLKTFLEEHDFEVWMDEEGIAGGVDFMSAIGRSSLLLSRFEATAYRSRPFTCAL